MNLDASAAAKQMASLSAVGLARMAKVPPGPSAAHPQAPHSGGVPGSGSYLGAMSPNGHSAGHDSTNANSFGGMPGYTNFQASNGTSMAQHQQLNNPSNIPMPGNPGVGGPPAASTLKQRQRNFLNGLTSVMSAKGTPLPPALTGIQNPEYDPNTSHWKILEPSTHEIGAFRLAGKDVDLFKLWGLVFQAGGHERVRLSC